MVQPQDVIGPVLVLLPVAMLTFYCCYSCIICCRVTRRDEEAHQNAASLARLVAEQNAAALARLVAGQNAAALARARLVAGQNAAALARARLVAVERASTLLAAAPAVKKKLGYFPYSAAGRQHTEASGESQLMCAICLETFVHGATCSEVPACQHFFHQGCIEEWMRSTSTCPLCRATIVPGSEPLSAAEDMV